jgi:hypothetical protein
MVSSASLVVGRIVGKGAKIHVDRMAQNLGQVDHIRQPRARPNRFTV